MCNTLPVDGVDAVEPAGRRWATVGIFGRLQFGLSLLDLTFTILFTSATELSLTHMAVLLSSHCGMIATIAMDLYSCMRENDRQNGRKMPHPTLRLRKPQLWISTSKRVPIKLLVLVWMVCALYARILIASSHLQMRVQASESKLRIQGTFVHGC